MKDRKIILALSHLSVYELNSFGKFLHSPFFNQQESLVKYFECVEKALRNQTVDSLEPSALWTASMGQLPFHNQKFLKLSSDLTGLLEQFLAQKEFDQQLSLKIQLTIEGARKRNIDNLYNGIVGEIDRLQKKEINQSSDYYLTRYQIEKNLFSLKTENEKKNEKFEITSELNISNISNNLDIFYVAEKLRHYCTLLSWKKMYQLDISMAHMDTITQLANRQPYLEIPAIQIYNTIRLTYEEEENEAHYFSLKELINKHIYQFPQEEQREIYATAISYCINKGNKNVSTFHKETFDIYKAALTQDIILQNNQLSPTTYRNIVPIALRVNEFTWAENFIHDYAPYVDEKYRNNAVEFSLARLEFYRRNFDKVLQHLHRVSYDDVWYNLNVKSIMILAYYELDEFDALESLLQAFRMYIKREKSLSADRKNHYLNLIKFTTALMKMSVRDQDKLKKLRDEITAAKGVVSKPWLLEKVDEMIKK